MENNPEDHIFPVILSFYQGTHEKKLNLTNS